MKYVLTLVTAMVLTGTCWAQAASVDDLKAQIEQQKEELKKLQDNISSADEELDSVKGKISESDEKIVGINDKIQKLCEDLSKAAGGDEQNPACK